MRVPAVSIIIPCHNRATMVGDAIASALAQGPAVEVIVIDDGSTDDSWLAISSVDGVVAERQANRGVSAARNRGLDLANGQFVRFLDSDDLLPQGAVDAQLQASRSLGPKEIGVGSAMSPDDSPGNRYGFSGALGSGPIPATLLLRHTMPCVLPLFPRETFAATRFDEQLTLSEDYVLAASLHGLGYRFVQQPVVNYVVRDHANARLSRTIGATGYSAQLTSLRKALFAAGVVGKDERRAMGQLAWVIGRDASREGFGSEATALFRFARSLDVDAVEVAPAPLRFAYRLLSPYRSERVFDAVKRILARPA